MNLAHKIGAAFLSSILAFGPLLVPLPLSAQSEGVAITITPPLFQLTIGPGEVWSSSLKIVNNNSYDVTYYANVMEFEAVGETGQSQFVPVVESRDSVDAQYSLAQWITMGADRVTVPRQSTGEFPFTVRVPVGASPGGHYAAILVGTQPGDVEISGPTVKIASFVSSLLFVRIRGDVTEDGRIREFRSEKTLYQRPEGRFILRFENTGNTHLRPEGDIVIHNMWGKERGRVQINQRTNFGNVLPQTTRKFEFAWGSESSIFDIGRYRATVTLSFGEDSKRNVTATNTFWIVPVVPVALTLASIILIITTILWFIRRYVRRALELERGRLGVPASAPTPVPNATLHVLMEPLREGVIDLRTMASGKAAPQSSAQSGAQQAATPSITLFGFARKYALFFAFIAVIIIIAIVAWMFVKGANTPEGSFEITDVSSEQELPVQER